MDRTISSVIYSFIIYVCFMDDMLHNCERIKIKHFKDKKGIGNEEDFEFRFKTELPLGIKILWMR